MRKLERDEPPKQFGSLKPFGRGFTRLSQERGVQSNRNKRLKVTLPPTPWDNKKEKPDA